ncbi:methyltransferase domain-containing protein [Polyangium mundeleinium]|uniref:Methyltransferase domain-containing protein n=1 Tax=Polyangium mundeleinium TaxID=2995306 RepID=A0ABT5ES35_9BACT|nr:methyltransferase domain-containing protein [Polyangium mundeleinium]MDC0744634.1 methyltransferase domain-containing protein [Polyangium mundeleinium]
MWDPKQYNLFREARRRPFFDLLAQVKTAAPARVVDLGCGTGDLTLALGERWPAAEILGVDSSAAMLAEARANHASARVGFLQADLARVELPGPADVLFSNAALHWLDDHAGLLTHLAGLVASGGTLAFQIPANFDAPSHRRVEEVRALPRFAAALRDVRRGHAEPLAFYLDHLVGLGFVVEAWETTYLHVLPGDDAVLQWLLGTTLRPLVTTLGPEEATAFLDTLRPLLQSDYPARPYGTPFPFTRRFVVATRVPPS